VCLRLWSLDDSGGLSDRPLSLAVDGVLREVQAGETLTLTPGQSIHVPPLTFHQFWGAEGDGSSFSIEVSSVCDDYHDNFFLYGFGERFPKIEEDEPRRWVLVNEYATLAASAG
jgi:hypothetical protein